MASRVGCFALGCLSFASVSCGSFGLTDNMPPALFCSRFGVTRAATPLFAADVDYAAELKKLEKEAEERLDAKVAELMGNIANTGVASK
jgi:hypothetical protein